jgi:hypothetical protein
MVRFAHGGHWCVKIIKIFVQNIILGFIINGKNTVYFFCVDKGDHFDKYVGSSRGASTSRISWVVESGYWSWEQVIS